jgi:uncharacterized protein YndB with AHSA1/START domain
VNAQATSPPAAIRQSVTVPAPFEVAFAAFTDGIHAWWPRELTWSGELLHRVAIEPRPGGFCYEIGAGGMRHDWGRVSTWQPPDRFAFAWLIRPDRLPEPNPAHASDVTVTFRRAGSGTRVTVVHDGWERHGEGGADYRRQFAEGQAWPRMLEAYAAVVATRDEAPWTGLTT